MQEIFSPPTLCPSFSIVLVSILAIFFICYLQTIFGAYFTLTVHCVNRKDNINNLKCPQIEANSFVQLVFSRQFSVYLFECALFDLCLSSTNNRFIGTLAVLVYFFFRETKMIAFSLICIKLINYLIVYWKYFLNARENEETDRLQIDSVDCITLD